METQMKAIAKEAADEAVNELLERLGVDINNPLEMQEDFAFIRSYRQLSQRIGSRVLMTVVTLITVGVAGLIWSRLSGKGW